MQGIGLQLIQSSLWNQAVLLGKESVKIWHIGRRKKRVILGDDDLLGLILGDDDLLRLSMKQINGITPGMNHR